MYKIRININTFFSITSQQNYKKTKLRIATIEIARSSQTRMIALITIKYFFIDPLFQPFRCCLIDGWFHQYNANLGVSVCNSLHCNPTVFVSRCRKTLQVRVFSMHISQSYTNCVSFFRTQLQDHILSIFEFFRF